MKAAVHAIAHRLSLRPPQKESLEILDKLCELLRLEKGEDTAAALQAVTSAFPRVTDFERDFPSLCFALATGVGKTRLMGAFIAYLNQTGISKHFFVLAPNLTIYNKLIADFSPGSPKYVFKGIAEFGIEPPEIITGDNYESGRGVRSQDLFGESGIHVNIFNISKINSEVRGGKEPRIKRLREYIGDSYFEYLSKLPDLVLLMDESHRYRASAGVRAINELKPILGLELTATPQVEAGAKTLPFKNVVYSYPLSHALRDGFVKEPAVATRENFNPAKYDLAALEKLKLEDGVRIHEQTKVQLQVYALQNERPVVKPFMLVVARHTEHADDLQRRMEDQSFFEGRYKGRVITVHSGLSGEERDETVEQLLSVESPENPTEVVIHVNMLKEGWDVTNLYTIVPLRAADSRTLVEQSIGRGLRLPYGKRTGVADVDRLTIVAHDRFQDIVDEANRPDSVIRAGIQVIYVDRDIPSMPSQVVPLEPVMDRILAEPAAAPEQGFLPAAKPLFDTTEEREVARLVAREIQKYEKLPRSEDLKTPEVLQKIVESVNAARRPAQGELEGVARTVDVAAVAAKTVERFVELSIDVPRITVVPTGEVSSGYRDFDLDCGNLRLQPVAQEILIQHLHDLNRYRLMSGEGFVTQTRLENYLVSGLVDFDDINYDYTADLLYKLAGQAVAHLRSYLKNDEEVVNVLQFHQRELVRLIYAQMQPHYKEKAEGYEVRVSRGFLKLGRDHVVIAAGEAARDYRAPVDDKLYIRGMCFRGFRKCLRELVKFDSDTERRFAVVLESDEQVLKWVKPAKGDIRISYGHEEEEYIPDFIAETATSKYLCETKRSSEMADPVVLAKARAAALWCQRASQNDAKLWAYLLISHEEVLANMTLSGLAARHRFTDLPARVQ
jgi:type III restriction enzyme